MNESSFTGTGEIVALRVEGSGLATAEVILNYTVPHTELTEALGLRQKVEPVAFRLTTEALWHFSAPDGVVTCRHINLAAPYSSTSAPITHVLLRPEQDHLAGALMDAGWSVGRTNALPEEINGSEVPA